MRRKVSNYSHPGSFEWYLPSVADCFILLLWLLVGALLGNLANLGFVAALGQENGAEYGMLVAYPLMFIPAMVYASAKSRSRSLYFSGVKLSSNHFGTLGWPLAALLCTAGVLTLGFCVDALTAILPSMPKWLEDTLKSMTTGKLWINLLTVSVFAPLCEEWLCRGMVMRGLLQNGMKPIWSIVISALFFAIIHLNPWQALPAFLLGCLFGYVYFKTGCLWLTILMHCVNNSFAVLCSHIQSLKDMETWMDVFSGSAYWTVFAACLIIVILVIQAFSKIEADPRKGNMDSVPPMFEG